MNMKTEKKYPLMPQATAVWLVDNTSLTFVQIADFCGLHELEVKGIADGNVAQSIKGIDPIMNKQLTAEEIKRCQNDATQDLQLSYNLLDEMIYQNNKSKAKYVARARRQDKPDAIFWLIKNYPDLDDKKIIKLIGTTKNTVQAIREKTYWNLENIRPRDPVLLALCSQVELNRTLSDIAPKAHDDLEKGQDKSHNLNDFEGI